MSLSFGTSTCLNVRREGLIPKLSEEDRSCLYGLVWCRSGKDVILLFFVRPNSFVLATGGLRGLIFSRFLRTRRVQSVVAID